MYTSINMLPYTKWLALPLGTRQKIASEFNILKLRATHVADNQILDDGYNVANVEKAMSVESLQTYLNSSEKDLLTLFQMLVDKIEGRTPPVIETPVVEVVKTKKYARKTKTNS